MKYLWTTINVGNMDESINFYSDLLDLKLQSRFPAGPTLEIAFMGNGIENETLVEFLADSSKTEVNFNDFISIGFAVESMDEMMDVVTSKGISVHAGPFETPAAKFFIVKDPNGLNIQLFQSK